MIKAVIIAAGGGRRLLPFTETLPKPLMLIHGKPLLDRVLNALENAGVNQCIVVTGYMKHALRRYLNKSKFGMEIRCCYNSKYINGNATSLNAAQKLLSGDDRFLLLMADHLIDENIVKTALENIDKAPLLCVDYKPYKSQIEEATKVLVDSDGYVKDIGKNIVSWNAIDTGVFLLDNQIFKIISHMEHRAPPPLTLSKCVKKMIRNGNRLWACDVSGSFWFDIDTIEDIVLAEQLLGRH